MATQLVLIDDIEGGPADESIAFVINGDSYTIDLSTANAAIFMKLLDPYIQAATKITQTQATDIAEQLAGVQQRIAIRTWAKRRGLDISERGRIPQDVVDEYQNQQKQPKKR